MFQGLIQKYKLLKQQLVSINWNRAWEDEQLYLDELIRERQTYPEDCLYNSLFQYRCQIFGVNNYKLFLLHIITLFGCIYLLSKYWFAKYRKFIFLKHDVAYFYNINIFSKEIRNNKSLIFIEGKKGLLLIKDVNFILKVLIKTKFNFIILSSVIYRVAQARYAVRNFGVTELWVNMEYSCASGALHKYCTINNLKLNNFMHGEKVLTLRDAFSSFDNFYIWEGHYKHIFQKLNTNANLIINNPWNKIAINRKNVIPKSICYVLKGLESDEEIFKLTLLFDKLKENGYEIFVKDHPRQRKVSNRFSTVTVINELDIIECFKKYEAIVAQYSTILVQCNYFKIPAYVDNISNISLYNKLIERGYPIYNSKIEELI